MWEYMINGTYQWQTCVQPHHRLWGHVQIMVDAWEDFNLMFNGYIYGGEFHLL